MKRAAFFLEDFRTSGKIPWPSLGQGMKGFRGRCALLGVLNSGLSGHRYCEEMDRGLAGTKANMKIDRAETQRIVILFAFSTISA